MERSALILSIKCFVLLFFFAFTLTGCGSSGLVIEVWISNQTQDRIKVNNNRHIEQEERISHDFLIKPDEKTGIGRAKGSFKIYRSNTHLATVTYEGEVWPDPSKGENSYRDEIIIGEPGERNTFTASSFLGVLSVSITHID